MRPYLPLGFLVCGLLTAGFLGACEKKAPEPAAPPNEVAEPITRAARGAGMETLTMTGALEVSVTYRERMMIPDGSTVRVTLSDVSRADAPAEVIAEETLETTGGPPYVVVLNYDPAKLDRRGRFSVSARIEHDGELLFITDTNNAVLTGGAPTERVEVVARRAGANGTSEAGT